MKKLLIALLLLSGCGFTPMYHGQTVPVYVDRITGTNGVDLRNQLESKFGTSSDKAAEYRLVVNLKEPYTVYKAIQETGDATWQEVRMSATYTLYKGDTVITKGADSAAESYTFVRYLVAANASYNSAVQNSITVLAEKISARVMASINE